MTTRTVRIWARRLKVLKVPLSRKTMLDKNGGMKHVSGIVPVTLDEIFGPESNDDIVGVLAMRLTGTLKLEDVEYKVVGFEDKGKTVLFEVHGAIKAKNVPQEA
jgi:hypothetical protein